jgi:hypothetical protein
VSIVAINVIVIAVTLMIGGFVVVWLAVPRCRPWIEAPKWQPLAWDRSTRASEDSRRRGTFPSDRHES